MEENIVVPEDTVNISRRITNLIRRLAMVDIVSSNYAADQPCFKCGEHPRVKNISYCRQCYNTLKRERWYLSAKSNSHETRRDYNLRAHFGITQEEYDLMFFMQGGYCAICGKQETKIHPWTGKVWPLCVDHNHETGDVRQLLCHGCNTLLGRIERDKLIIKKLEKYLKKHAT